MVTFTSSMKTKYMFEFLYVNSYSGLRGLISYAFSAAAVVALCFGYGDSGIALFFLIVLALLFTVIDPLLLLFKAWQQVKITNVFKEPITYNFSDEGFLMTQGEQSQDYPYELILLAKETIGSVILFTGNNNAIILPKKDIGNQLNALKKLLKEHRPDECSKLKVKSE